MPRIEYRADKAIRDSDEFRRVAGLPWRTWDETESVEMADLLTRELKTRAGTWKLKPIQGVALADCFEVGGLFASIGVGKGKTLISLLAGTVLEARRPILLVKPDLLEKTRHDIREMSKQFAVHPNLQLYTYSQLSSAKFTNQIQDYGPDLVIADEGQALKNINSARGRKFMRAMRDMAKAGHPAKFVCMSGTMMRRSLHDYWHLITLALPATSPLPYSYTQLTEWASAIDQKVPEFARCGPGVLLSFLPDTHEPTKDPVDLARIAYRNRFRSTSGVVVTGGDEEDVNASLMVREIPVTSPQRITDALAELRKTWQTPAGDELQYALELWRIAREMASGLFYRWDPVPPKEWLIARKDWRVFVREMINLGRAGLDSPQQVALAYPDEPSLERWRAIRGTFVPNSVGVWVDDYLVNAAATWLEQEKGICWVEHNEFGLRLSEVTGVRYFGGGKQSSLDVLTHRGPAIMSIRSHGTGKNFQDRYNKCLVASCPPSGDIWEQLLGRCHRMGIDEWADEVVYDAFLPCEEMREGMQTALDDARMVNYSKGMSQKLLIADIAMGDVRRE